MQPGKFNVVTDSQHGSCGKGLITSALAMKYCPEIITTTNMANAGHSTVWYNGDKFVAKALPSATILTKWTDYYKPTIFVGASAAFDIEQLEKEIQETEVSCLYIHPRAGVITQQHRETENSSEVGTKHIASTMQGCGAFLSDKIMRRQTLKLARDYPQLSKYIFKESIPIYLNTLLQEGSTILHEGAQGFSLDINHGSHYPACTSRGTTATQNLADIGLPTSTMGDIYLVVRPFPIRVGNVVENGRMVGYSGDCYSDQHEISWEDVAKSANMPEDIGKNLLKTELTTVTKRLRRVFSFSKQQLKEAAVVNGATKIALNFANYLDWSCYGTSELENLPPKVVDFINQIEDVAGIPVTIVGTGPQINHVCFL